MLSDEGIDKLIFPFVRRQEEINTYVISFIAERIKAIGAVLPSDVWKLQQLYKYGTDAQKLNKELARLTGLQVSEIRDIIRFIAQDAYLDALPYYDYTQTPYIPFAQNVEMQRMIKAIGDNTIQTYINLSRAQAFMIRDLANPQILHQTSISRTYQTVIDEAIQASAQGVIDYNTAMRRTMRQLINSGIRTIEYQAESGRFHTQRMDTAVKRNILQGIRQTYQGMHDLTGKEFGADGKELSVHHYPAPDHAPVQGHQFTNEQYERMQNGLDFYDYNGQHFEGFDRAIGTLNCKHYPFSIILGVFKPNYTPEQLQAILTENQKGFTDAKGKHYTGYECTQKQRQMETEIRKAKDGQIAARAAGDDVLAKEYQAKINQKMAVYKQFSQECGIAMRKDNLTVSGYHKISTK